MVLLREDDGNNFSMLESMQGAVLLKAFYQLPVYWNPSGYPVLDFFQPPATITTPLYFRLESMLRCTKLTF